MRVKSDKDTTCPALRIISIQKVWTMIILVHLNHQVVYCNCFISIDSSIKEQYISMYTTNLCELS
mgnify:CR=1 FL=1